MGTYLRVFSESYPMNTNMPGFIWFSKMVSPCAFDEGSLSIGERSNGICEQILAF